MFFSFCLEQMPRALYALCLRHCTRIVVYGTIVERVKTNNKNGGSMRREEVGTAVTEQQQLPYFFKLFVIMTLKYPSRKSVFSLEP